MKNLFLLSLISFSAGASNWMPVSAIQNKATAGYQLEKDCPGKCLDVGNNIQAITDGDFSLTPLYGGARKSVDECDGKEECETLIADKECLQNQAAFIDEDYKFVYCMDEVSKQLVINEAAVAQKLAIKNQKAQYEAGIGQATKAMDCGRRVIALLIVRNASKNLTTQQVGQMVSTYEQPKGLLETGSLVTAKEVILNIPADGTLVTEGDKTALASEIDKCKP